MYPSKFLSVHIFFFSVNDFITINDKNSSLITCAKSLDCISLHLHIQNFGSAFLLFFISSSVQQLSNIFSYFSCSMYSNLYRIQFRKSIPSLLHPFNNFSSPYKIQHFSVTPTFLIARDFYTPYHYVYDQFSGATC